MGYAYIWAYTVRTEHLEDFLSAYRPNGEWARLFADSPGYLRTELHRDRENQLRFVTIDYWDSAESWVAFRSRKAAEFEAIDAQCEQFTTEECELGRFDPIDGDDVSGES